MWSPFYPLLSLAAGFINHFQQSLNVSNSGVIPLPEIQYDGLVPYIQFARAAYCDSSKIAGWLCGGSLQSSTLLYLDELMSRPDACDAVPDFVVTLTGGDGDGTQFCK